MSDEKERILGNSLQANELLQNKGICNKAWNEWEKSSRALPKVGKKQFEPNGSLLQNLQIEKHIKNRKDLLSIERVERQSHLAIAEWLPDHKKAHVVKKSGQSWSNFGHDMNCTLFLFPEEALLLLEMSCLELRWNGIPLSLQQAYEILLNDSTCSLEEYRVYSQLVRCGYRLQRFIYIEPEKNSRPDELQKKKVIVDPANGLRIDINKAHPSTAESSILSDITKTNVTSMKQIMCDKVQNHAHETCQHDNANHNNSLSQTSSTDIKNTTLNEVKGNNGSSKPKNSKVEIISEETFLGGIKIIKEPPIGESLSRLGKRISRNIKVMPKRTDKPSCSAMASSPVNKNTHSKEIDSIPCAKRRIITSDDDQESKKTKQEVIELSDEEIEEVPRPMTRMEMLNLLPTIAKKTVIVERIPRKYIPSTIKPQNYVYHYERSRLLNAQGKKSSTHIGGNKSGSRNYYNRGSHQNQNTMVPYRKQNQHRHVHNTNVYELERRQFTGMNSVIYNNRLPLNILQNIYMHHRVFQQGIFQNILNYVGCHSTFQDNRCLSIQMNNFSNTSIIQRNCSMQTPYQQNMYQNVSLYERFYQRDMILNMSSHCSTSRNSFNYARQQNSGYRSFNDYNNTRLTINTKEVSKSSFTTYPGSSSWQELKKRWREEEKTITIDDEENTNRDTTDSGEIEVVHHSINPLVGPKNAKSLAEIYNRLRIIKSAPEEMVRKKRSSYKISYNVFSSAQHYRKSNPGEPVCRIVVLRKNDNVIIKPIELSRLQQDAAGVPIILAYVCMSISYIQPGGVSLPDLTKQ